MWGGGGIKLEGSTTQQGAATENQWQYRATKNDQVGGVEIAGPNPRRRQIR